ncbi:hypothetical protein BFX22_01545 [Vibrio cholerae]|nr:hypothetical protein [Vibrio cholerae]OEJ12381.1 hypothetical protein BFX26_01545 [Vibrio cholerae]OFI92586.1 hypothetical protein BFX20_01620 [Vibrio cholerae]OFI99859.1 hypothetical protein BFX22_01545 [Vibrio cholerae]
MSNQTDQGKDEKEKLEILRRSFKLFTFKNNYIGEQEKRDRMIVNSDNGSLMFPFTFIFVLYHYADFIGDNGTTLSIASACNFSPHASNSTDA